ncbi:MAG: NUDIX domain-containing protein [Rubrobacteraceae bacterium]
MGGSRVVLLRNERGEWELPGGKLEPDESPEECVAREILEELNLRVEVGPLLNAWLYEVLEGVRVFVVTYGCHVESPPVCPAAKSIPAWTLSTRTNWRK